MRNIHNLFCNEMLTNIHLYMLNKTTCTCTNSQAEACDACDIHNAAHDWNWKMWKPTRKWILIWLEHVLIVYN